MSTRITNNVQGHKRSPPTFNPSTLTCYSLESLTRHLQIVVLLRFRQTLEVHQTGMEFLVIIPKLEEKITVCHSFNINIYKSISNNIMK